MARKADLNELFHRAMFILCERAKLECNHDDTDFRHLLSEKGGLQAAKNLLQAPEPSESFAALRKRKKLGLTVEALVVENPHWRSLVTKEERATAEKRLKACGYKPKKRVNGT